MIQGNNFIVTNHLMLAAVYLTSNSYSDPLTSVSKYCIQQDYRF